LPGCSAFGENEEKALEEIKMAMELWLETAKKKREEKFHNHMEKNSSSLSLIKNKYLLTFFNLIC